MQLQLLATPKSMRERRPELAAVPALERVIARCLTKDPDARYADMADLEAALCEAQIADRLSTPWDDLPLPDLPDLDRRERLLRAMPTPGASASPRNRWLWPVVAGASTLAAVALGLFLAFGRPTPPAAVDDTIEQLALQARDAAAKLNWVLPPPGEPEAPTAYDGVRALEATQGPTESLADLRGATLRSEFAATLARQGDVLWDQGAKLAATNHYLWALAFEPSNRHAYERAGVDNALLLDFIRRANARDFTASELALGLIATVQTQHDDPAQFAANSEQIDAALEGLSPQAAVMIGDALDVEGMRPRRPKPGAALATPPTVAVAGAPDPTPVAAEPRAAAVIEADPAMDDAKGGRRRRNLGADPRAVLGGAERDPARASALADEGLAALRAGRRADASSLFNQAIAFDRSNAAALMGLSDIAFDTGADTKAVTYAEKAVEASPANAGFRLKLGDAYFKVLRYREALTQYEEAGKRGSSRADERIARVKAKLGE